jgi:hypothetical protein
LTFARALRGLIGAFHRPGAVWKKRRNSSGMLSPVNRLVQENTER